MLYMKLRPERTNLIVPHTRTLTQTHEQFSINLSYAQTFYWVLKTHEIGKVKIQCTVPKCISWL